MRSTDLHCLHKRPQDPKDLHFELNLDYIPEVFLPNGFESGRLVSSDHVHYQTDASPEEIQEVVD